MINEQERLSKFKIQRSKEAINLAMQGRWRDAIDANKDIINAGADVDAYNRLGRAYMEIGEYTQARDAYNHTVELDPLNTIARKNLQKLKYLEGVKPAPEGVHKVEPRNFIEEMGKAGVVRLFSPGSKQVLARMVAGDGVIIKKDGSSLIAEDLQGEYLGQVDPHHTQRLIKLMDTGNKYSASVVSSTEGSMTIIIRETYQDPANIGRLSFPPRGLEEVRPFVGDRLLKVESEEENEHEAGYTIIGGAEVETVTEDSGQADEDTSENEE